MYIKIFKPNRCSKNIRKISREIYKYKYKFIKLNFN